MRFAQIGSRVWIMGFKEDSKVFASEENQAVCCQFTKIWNKMPPMMESFRAWEVRV